jgi:hypothetical protein
VVNASVTPRRVVYLDALPSAGAQVMVDATASVDPEGQPLNYAADANGDGVLSQWFFRPESSEQVTMPGPFVITARAQDPLGAVGEQQVHMLARQFSTRVASGASSSPGFAFALANGRPAFFFESSHGDLMMTSSDGGDGTGRWSTAVVKPVDVVRDWLGAREFNWGTTCRATEHLGVALVCAFKPKNGGYMLRYLRSTDPASGEWSDLEVVRVSEDPAAMPGAVGYFPAILYYNNSAVVLLMATWAPGADAVRVGGGFELVWSLNVGNAPRGSHSGVIGVGPKLDQPAFAYLDAARAQLIYVVGSQADGRGKWDMIPVEGQNGDTGTPSLALIGGRPAIAYRDGARGWLKLATSEAVDGRGKWTVRTVYAPADKSPRTQSLAEIDGRAGIAFEDAARGLLFAYDPGGRADVTWPVAAIAPPLPAVIGAPRAPVLIAAGNRPAIGYGPWILEYAIAR